MKIRYLGHSCFQVEMGGKTILFDPFIKPNHLAADIDIAGIKTDFILLSHGHMDHVADAEEIARNNDAMLVSNFEIVSWYENRGLRGYPLNIGGSCELGFGRVRYVTAVHSSVLPDGTYGGNPGGFVIESPEAVLYFAGDTALTLDMQLIPRICKPLDIAILPIGDNFTMGADDAVLASDFIGCDRIIGCHYDTFGYIKIDQEAARKKFADRNKELILLEVGASMEL